MAVLIKNMEMPLPGTFNIIYIYSDGQVHMPSWGKGMTPTNGVKAVPVPEPHGRLGDLDELKTAFPCGEHVRTESVRATIDHMKTVIPASEDGET